MSSAVRAGPVGMWVSSGCGRCGVQEVCHRIGGPQALPSAPEVGRPYTPPMIATEVDGFLSLGQPTARRIARRRGVTATLLVHGPSGSGKEAFVDDLLALAFCTDADAGRRPCNACRGCRDARARSIPTCRGVTGALAGASLDGGDHRVRRPPLAPGGSGRAGRGLRRVVLIEHADGANEQVQNALLKALEEPTDRHTFILVADEPTRLLPTIRSRCQPLRIGPVPRAELVRIPDGPPPPAGGPGRDAGAPRKWPCRHGDHVRRSPRPAGMAAPCPVAAPCASRPRQGGPVRRGGGPSGRGGPSPGPRPGRPRTTRRGRGRLARCSAPRRPSRRSWLDLTRDLIVAARPRRAGAGDRARARAGAPGARIGPAPWRTWHALLERIHDGLGENAAPAWRSSGDARLAQPQR